MSIALAITLRTITRREHAALFISLAVWIDEELGPWVSR